MFVLKRKVGESITIGNNITITVKRSTDGVTHLAIDAPREVPVMRTELLTKAKTEKESNDQHAS